MLISNRVVPHLFKYYNKPQKKTTWTEKSFGNNWIGMKNHMLEHDVPVPTILNYGYIKLLICLSQYTGGALI